MVICKEIVHLLQRYQFNKDVSAKIVSGQILAGDIQVIVKLILEPVLNSLEPDRTDDKCNMSLKLSCYAIYHLKWYSFVAKRDIVLI